MNNSDFSKRVIINGAKNLLANDLLHSQSVLAHWFPAIFVAAGLLFKEETLREPKGAVLSLPPCNQHANHEDD